jgi:putative flippase GtrA
LKTAFGLVGILVALGIVSLLVKNQLKNRRSRSISAVMAVPH